MNYPLVSVICLCHNHERFVTEAMQSVLDQTYPNVELIVVDDGSTDNSVDVIRAFAADPVTTIFLDQNQGNCSAFNLGYGKSSGEFLIDLAADDVLLPDRITSGVLAFAENDIGVHHGNMMMIAEDGSEIGVYHNDKADIPQGWIYSDLLGRHFIGGPSMMVKRRVLDDLQGYDESLAYEDFDFWVRSSRHYRYLYTNQVMVKKRVVHNSLSSRQYRFGSAQLRSTYKVCVKASELNQSHAEELALDKRIRYELRNALLTGNLKLAVDFLRLYSRKKAT